MLSNKGATLKCFEGYIHRRKRFYHDRIYWTCVEPNCKGKLTTIDGEVVSGPKDHHHEPSISEYLSRQQRNLAKKDARENPSRKGREIYDRVNSEIINGFPFDEDLIGVSLKPFSGLKPTINRVKRLQYPPLPTTIADLSIPTCLKRTKKDELFLLRDNLEPCNRILIFGTPSFIRIMCGEERVFADGTFKCVPHLFNSLYTLHVMRDGLMITILYCLLTNRTSRTYINMLRMIQDICVDHASIFNPQSFTIDFEAAMITAINTVFPVARIMGCLFHFTQCLRRKVQEIGLSRQYAANSGKNEIQKTVRRVAALAFVKIEDLDESFTEIVQQMPENDQLDEFMSYFYDNFFKRNSRFKREIWNHFYNDGPRTNNHVEGWHNSFNQRINRYHVNIWIFLEKMIEQQEIFENNLLIARQGTQINPRNRKDAARDKRIQLQKLKYEQGRLTKLEFIDSIRYNFSLNIV